MRASRILPVAAVAAMSTVLFGAPAFADTGAVLTAGGQNVAVGDTLSASLVSGGVAFFATSSGGTSGVSCSVSTFSASVSGNPAAPGTASESITGQTFGTCTSNVVGTTGVNGVTVTSLPMVTTVASDGTVTVGSTAAPVTTSIKLRTLLGSITCGYTAANGSISGVASNTNNSIAFANQPFNKASGSVLCPSNGYFTATYSPITDNTAGGAAVVVN
jgi:hypothetical protein